MNESEIAQAILEMQGRIDELEFTVTIVWKILMATAGAIICTVFGFATSSFMTGGR